MLKLRIKPETVGYWDPKSKVHLTLEPDKQFAIVDETKVDISGLRTAHERGACCPFVLVEGRFPEVTQEADEPVEIATEPVAPVVEPSMEPTPVVEAPKAIATEEPPAKSGRRSTKKSS